MRKRFPLTASVAVSVVLCASPAQTRVIDTWTYKDLFAKADLVVVATAQETVAAKDTPPEQPWNYEFVAQNTTLKVVEVLRGEEKGKTIQILHFKFGKLKKGVEPNSADAVIVIDGPMLVDFRSEPVLAKVGKEKKVLPAPEYLLFLKRKTDGRYEPLSGQIDPALSIREMNLPRAESLSDK